jgi:hypothetical protein
LPPSTITQEAGGVLESAVSDAGLFPIKKAKELEKPLEEKGITLPHDVTMTNAMLKEAKKLKREEDKNKCLDVATTTRNTGTNTLICWNNNLGLHKSSPLRAANIATRCGLTSLQDCSFLSVNV